MSWWSWIKRLAGKLVGTSAWELSPEENAALGGTPRGVARELDLATPHGVVRVPLLVEVDGRTRCVFRLSEAPSRPAAEELLRRIAQIHSVLEDAEVCLLGEFGRLPSMLLPYLRPTRGARIALLTWLESVAGARRPLHAALRHLPGIEIGDDCASLDRARALLREDFSGFDAAARSAPPALAVQHELALALGRALRDELGGSLEPPARRWTLQRTEGRFSVDLGRWIELALGHAEGHDFGDLPRELGRHLADPSYLLDPLSFAASSWEPAPAVPRPLQALQGPMAAFAEMRAEATLAQGPETQDSGDIVMECPGCHGLTSLLVAFAGTEAQELTGLLLALYAQVYQLEHTCSHCATTLSSRDFRVARLFRLLPDTGADLALQLSRSEDGRVAVSVRVFAEGGRVLEHSGLSDKAVRELCGRPISARAAWLGLFERALSSGVPETERFDASSVGLVVPAGTIPTDESLQVLFGPEAGSSETMILRLSELDSDDLPFLEGTYHQWAGPFEADVQDGSLTAALLVDYARLRGKFREALGRAGAEPKEEVELTRVRLGRQRMDVPLRARVVEAVHTGRQVEERILMLAAECIGQLRKMDAFVNKIQQICGPEKDYRFDQESGVLHVLKPGSGEGSSFNVPSLLLKFGGDEEQLERMVRAMSRDAEPSLERCKCGAPAYVSLKMKPPEWAAGQSGGTDVICERHNGVIFAYSVDCEEHSGYLDRESMARLGLGLEDLRRRFHRDLDQNDYQVGLLVLRDGAHSALGVLGTNAASLACHPALVRRALEMAGLDLGAEVRLYARSTDAIVVAETGAGHEFVASVGDKLDHILGQSLGLSSSSLHFDELVDLPARGRGRLREVFRVSRP